MQLIAREMNLSETAFLCKQEQKSTSSLATFDLRWFTPTVEVNLCGHATLAATHALVACFGERHTSRFEFQTLSGALRVTNRSAAAAAAAAGTQNASKSTSDEQSSVTSPAYSMDFPCGEPKRVYLSGAVIAQLSAALALPVDDIEHTYFCKRTKKLVVRVRELSTISNATCNANALLAIERPADVEFKGVIVTSVSNDTYNKENGLDNVDVVCRYFAPWVGINEDPVTGSAHTVLAVYYTDCCALPKIGENDFIRSYQASARGGIVAMRLIENKSRVELCGDAQTVLVGDLMPAVHEGAPPAKKQKKS